MRMRGRGVAPHRHHRGTAAGHEDTRSVGHSQ